MQRQIYLDNLRTICMVLGIFVHADHLGDFGAISAAPEVSNLFRMATFFIISGFLGAMLLERQGGERFLSGRLRNLAIPLFASLLLLNPPALWLVFGHFNDGDYGWRDVFAATFGGAESEGPMIWHLHLWFLFSLIAYVLMAPVLLPVMRRVAGRVVIGRGWLAPLACMACVAGAVLLAGGMWKVTDKLGIAVPWLVQTTVNSLPYYALGMFLYVCPQLWAAVRRVDPVGLVLLAGLVALGGLSSPTSTAGWVLYVVTHAVMRCWISFALIAVFERWVNARGPILTPMGDAIYTIYLFHYLLIYVVATALLTVLPLSPLTYLAVCVGVIAVGFALHKGIQHSAMLKLLFNGRVSRPAG